MNTGVGREGYSIIGQGKVAEIVSKKSDERRNIFEEAAGISKYRHRKEESERKLKSTQDNLDRVKDILSVLESRVGPLEKEAEKARKGLAIYEEKKRADVSLWLYDTKQIREDIEKAEDALKLSRHELEIVETVINDLNLQNDDIFAKQQENKASSSRIYDKIRETTEALHKLDNALRVAESQFAHSAELIAQCNQRIDEIVKSESNVNQTRSIYDERREEQVKIHKQFMDEKLEFLSLQQEVSVKVALIKRELEEALDELTVEENAATDLKVRIDVLKSSKVSDGTKSQDLEVEIAKYEEEGVALKAEAERCEQNAAGFKQKIEEKEAVINECNEKVEALTEEKAQITDTLNGIKLQRDELLQRASVLQRMVEHFEGYAESIKFVMREAANGTLNSPGKVHGPLSSLINVEKEYITAIETALGGSLQNIVVDDEGTAKAAMYALKRANAGRATFYPITAIRPATETDEIRKAKSFDGFVGRADTLVSTDSKYRSIIEFLLLRTVVFDNIDNASVAAKKLGYKVKMVTLDGQVINAGGAFTGGSAKKDSGILSRLTEISKLKEKGESLGSKIKECEDTIAEIIAEHKDAYEKAKSAEQEKELLLTLSRSQFAALDNANAKYNANRNILEKLNYDYNNLIGQQSKAEEEINNLSLEYDANLERIAGLKEFRAKRSEEMGVLDEKLDEYSQRINEIMKDGEEG
jgi:chromosome segregation protein